MGTDGMTIFLPRLFTVCPTVHVYNPLIDTISPANA